jgi:hypothetical protein
MATKTAVVKLPSTTSTSGSGAAISTGKIISVVGNVAQVRLSIGNQVVQVRTDLLRAKGVAPKTGENWILDQQFGVGWCLAAIASYPGLDAAAWAAPVLLGSWVNASTAPWTNSNGTYAPAGWLRDDLGWVSLRGTVTGGTASASNAAGPLPADIMQLPDGYRPPLDGQLRFPVGAGASSTGVVMVRPDGFVRAMAGATPISLDGIRFRYVQQAVYNVSFTPTVTLSASGQRKV